MGMTRRDVLRAIGATGIGLLAAACAPNTPAAAPTPAPAATSAPAATTGPAPTVAPAATSQSIQIVYTQPAAAFMALWIATDQGFFKKYGLTDFDVSRVSPPSDIQGLLSGEFH